MSRKLWTLRLTRTASVVPAGETISGLRTYKWTVKVPNFMLNTRQTMILKSWEVQFVPITSVVSTTTSNTVDTTAGPISTLTTTAGPPVSTTTTSSGTYVKGASSSTTESSTTTVYGVSAHTNEFVAIELPFLSNSIINTFTIDKPIHGSLLLPVEQHAIASRATETRLYFDVNTIHETQNILLYCSTDDIVSSVNQFSNAVLIFEVDIA